ncbi:MAG: prenyltransferase/squalene oxidase repeat-containing protein, partial [Verrucomicrobiota bacterium]
MHSLPATAAEPDQELERAIEHLLAHQDPSGCWKGRYNGPLFLIPSFIAAHLVTKTPMLKEKRAGMLRYLLQFQGDDGGWGLHLEDESRVYTTVSCYVSARWLGLERNSTEAEAAREWMAKEGDATAMAPWGKYLLALLGLYDYRGLLPVPPELWLLPRWLPLHPGRLWNHARMVYLPLSYLYRRGVTAPSTPFLEEIRHEIYLRGEPSWEKIRWKTGKRDRYRPLSLSYRVISRLLLLAERFFPQSLRERALDFVYDQVRQEDENTNYICVGPVSKVYNLLVRHDRDPEGTAMREHWREMETYLCYEDDFGVSVNGYNHSRLWDTTFAFQAMQSVRPRLQRPGIREALRQALGYVLEQQLQEEVPKREYYFRTKSTGGWPFSDALHGWPISDCTAEGLKVCLGFQASEGEATLDPHLLEAAVDRILEWQNADGGWPTYEKARAPAWLEKLNPSLVFAEIMVDHSHVECTSACMQALSRLPRLSLTRDAACQRAVKAGEAYLRKKLRNDGAWLGGWGVCFTYGAWFGTWGLRAAGAEDDDPALRKAAKFLRERQLPDGGWAETVEHCRTGKYPKPRKGEEGSSHPVKTAWAILALTRCGPGQEEAVEKGMCYLRQSLRLDG